MRTAKFWPLDYEPEDEIYDSLAWDLPGYRNVTPANPPRARRPEKVGHYKKIRL